MKLQKTKRLFEPSAARILIAFEAQTMCQLITLLITDYGICYHEGNGQRRQLHDILRDSNSSVI